jgi:hypothetical protein
MRAVQRVQTVMFSSSWRQPRFELVTVVARQRRELSEMCTALELGTELRAGVNRGASARSQTRPRLSNLLITLVSRLAARRARPHRRRRAAECGHVDGRMRRKAIPGGDPHQRPRPLRHAKPVQADRPFTTYNNHRASRRAMSASDGQ